MMISLRNKSLIENATFQTLSVQDQEVNVGETKMVYNNNFMSGMGPNSVETLQMCSELMGYIQNDILVFVVNGIEKDKTESLSIMQPNINL